MSLGHLKPGDGVYLTVQVAGISTCERRTVSKVSGGNIWLDCGPGNRPSGPYSAVTGNWANNGAVPGAAMWIRGLEEVA